MSHKKNSKTDPKLHASLIYQNMAKSNPGLAKWINKEYGKPGWKDKVLNRLGKASRQNAPADIGPLGGMFDSGIYSSVPLSMPFQLAADSSFNSITQNKVLLSYCYMTFGVIQTIVDQPVEDAFRGGINKIICDELDDDDKKKLLRFMAKRKTIQRIKETMKWAKLFGGAAMIINTAQDPKTELDLDAITQDSPLEFISADRWECIRNVAKSKDSETPYSYYSQQLHKSRVLAVNGKEAPSFIRPRLQGWGMSEVERLLRDANMYYKEQDVLYELIDESKQDVFKITGFNANMLSGIAAGKMDTRLQIATQLKNYHNAIILDKEDDYDQKEIHFAGLAEVMKQIMVMMSAAARMPMAKLFGLSAAGFNSGEDDIENYNSLIESEVRAKALEILVEVLPLECRACFGFAPEHIEIEFNPLRVLGEVEEEAVKTSKMNRHKMLYDSRMYNAYEFDQALRQENLISIETEVGRQEVEPERPEDIQSQMQEASQDHEQEMADAGVAPGSKGGSSQKDGKKPKPGDKASEDGK